MRRFTRLLSFQLCVLLFSMADLPRAEEDPSFSQRELDGMLAPIALYPDVVLSQVLMAATYPLEVVEAARWSKANPRLDGEAAVEAVDDKDWDASVKALVAFPRLLARMDEDLDWTKRVGDAFLFQQAEVMDTLQDLRRRAYEAGNLDDLDHARVIEDGDTILIEPAEPEIVYVPYYDTRVIYGGWWWPAYPPYCWIPPSYYLGTGFYWGGGVPYSSGLYFSYVSWPHRHIVVVNSRPAHAGKPGYGYMRGHDAQGGARHWRHDPRHRRGVVYRDRGSSHKYGRPRASAGGKPDIDRRVADRPRGSAYRHGSPKGGTAATGRGGGRASFGSSNDAVRAGTDTGRRPHGNRADGGRVTASTAPPIIPRSVNSNFSRHGSHKGWKAATGRGGSNDARRVNADTGRRPHGMGAEGQRRVTASAAPPMVPRAANPGYRSGDSRSASVVPPRAQAPRQAKGKHAGGYDSPRASVTSPVYGTAPQQGASIRAPAFSGQRTFAR